MEGLDECKSSSVEEVPGKNSKTDDNLSSKTSMDHPKWEFCDDIERSEILGRIRSLFCLLSKNNCLPPIHFRWAIEYAMDQFHCRSLGILAWKPPDHMLFGCFAVDRTPYIL
ncbi:hypothetical protein Q3G72_003946 [Acer saccharum]|nr:hypothetical protein Q3G72_003946 [Acer saccharum]